MTIPALALFMLAAVVCAVEPALTATPPAVQISPATMPPTAAPTPTPSPAATPTLLAAWNRFRASQVSLCLGIDL